MNGIATEAIIVHVKLSIKLSGYSLHLFTAHICTPSVILRTQTAEGESTIGMRSHPGKYIYIYIYSFFHHPPTNFHDLGTQ